MMRTFAFLFLILALFSCKPEARITGSGNNSYYPIEAGRFTEYDVTRTFYALSEASPKIQHYAIRQSIGKPFTDVSGHTAFPLNYSSVQGKTNWKLDSAGTLWSMTNEVLGIENGQVIIKLALPLEERNIWDGNAYNNLGMERYQVVNSGKPGYAGNTLFPKTVTIVRRNDSTLVRQKKYIEVYAEGIGLIRKEVCELSFCYTPGCSGKGIINSGWKEISIIKNYGNE
jgi:hypothetical protein